MITLLRIFLSTMLWLLLPAGLACAQQRTFTKQQVTEDLYQLKEVLETAHYDLYAYTTRERFQKAFSQALREVNRQDSLSLLAATTLFQQVISSVNTGHAEIDFPVGPYIDYASQGGTLFPLELALENNKAWIRNNLSDHPEIHNGMEVLSVNGQAIDKILEKIYPQLSAERRMLKNAKLEFWSFPRLYWQVFCRHDSFDIRIRENGTTSRYSLAAIPVMEYEEKRNGEILPSGRTLSFVEEGIAWLVPGPFSSAEENGEEKYRHFIDSAFTRARQNNTRVLIADLRNNSGGHNAYSDYLVSYFADRPFRWHAAFTIKTSEILKQQTRLHNDTTDPYFRTILEKPSGEIYTYPYPPREPVAEGKRFDGQVYVLVNRQTYSMAAVAAAMMQDYGFATIVGEETADMPTLIASQFTYPLPHTGIMVKVPKGYIIRPGGSEELRGVIPDIPIADHLLDDKDEILRGLLKRLAD